MHKLLHLDCGVFTNAGAIDGTGHGSTSLNGVKTNNSGIIIIIILPVKMAAALAVILVLLVVAEAVAVAVVVGNKGTSRRNKNKQ